MPPHPVFRLTGVTKVWAAPDEEFRLSLPHLEIRSGERIALLGPSGCGKSTLLDILAMTLQPTTCASFRFDPQGDDSADVREAWTAHRLDVLAGLRGRHIGYVLQTGGLLPFLTVGQNIELPRQVCGLSTGDTVAKLAQRLGIAGQLHKLPATLSVGQRQRAAVARALAHAPTVVLADEPTASLDPHTAAEVMDLFVELAAERNITLVVASHDWDRMTALGLTRLHHQQTEGSGFLCSEFRS
jgi:putative ABC transport system ATP-binding protein